MACQCFEVMHVHKCFILPSNLEGQSSWVQNLSQTPTCLKRTPLSPSFHVNCSEVHCHTDSRHFLEASFYLGSFQGFPSGIPNFCDNVLFGVSFILFFTWHFSSSFSLKVRICQFQVTFWDHFFTSLHFLWSLSLESPVSCQTWIGPLIFLSLLSNSQSPLFATYQKMSLSSNPFTEYFTSAIFLPFLQTHFCALKVLCK